MALPLFDVTFQEEPDGEWKTVLIDGQSIDDIPANFLFAYAGIYRPLSECADFRIELAHEETPNCWCEPEHVGDGVYVHKQRH